MKKIEVLLAETKQYFIDKIIASEYSIEKIDQHTVTLKIDEKYIFSIWIGNLAINLETYAGNYNEIAIKFTEEQQAPLHERFLNEFEKSKTESEYVQMRRKEYERLKLEFES